MRSPCDNRYPGSAAMRGIERRLVDADHARAQFLQHPAPAAGAAAEIEAELAGPRMSARQRQRSHNLR